MLPKDRYNGLNLSFEPSEEDIEIIRDAFLVSSSCEILPNLIRQIGSLSERGKVYDSLIKQIPVAIKVFDNTGHGNIAKFYHEREINEMITMYGDSDFFLRYLTGKICQEGKNSIGLIVMERAIGDLKQIITYSVINNHFLDETFSSVVACLFEMAELDIYHGDLHCGNIFTVLRNGKLKIVLGDFGESEYRNDSPNNSERDFYKFISTLRELITGVNRYNVFLKKLNIMFAVYAQIAKTIEFEFDEMIHSGLSPSQASKQCNINFLTVIWENYLSL